MSEEEHIEKQSTADKPKAQENVDEIILPADEASSQKPPIEVKEPTTEIMEVHKHPHHVTHKKKWGEYLLEFLMLFLAVFLGFIAENIREHSSERKKEKHLIASLKKELEGDTAHLTDLITHIAEHNKWVDSAVHYLNSEVIKGKEKNIAASLTNATIWFNYGTLDIAINEIKHTGVLNFVENDSAKNGILNYISLVEGYNKYSEPLNNARHSMDTSTSSVFTQGDLQKFTRLIYKNFKEGKSFISFSDMDTGIIFKTYAPLDFKRLSNKLEGENVLENDMLGQYQRLFDNDIILLKLLQKEYPN